MNNAGTGGFPTRTHALAATHVTIEGAPEVPVSLLRLARLPAWLDALVAHCSHADTVALEQAADWILDNDYRLRRALRQLERDLPPGRFARLPRLADGHRQARVLVVARALLDDCALQPESATLLRWLADYQSVRPLREAELWALPALLRLACVERLVAVIDTLTTSPASPFDTDEPRVDGQSDSHSDSQGDGSDNDAGNAAVSVEVGDVVTALVHLDEIDWREFVANASLVEALLAQEPAAVYPNMASATRIAYRQAIERLAQRTTRDETEVAERAVAVAGAHCPDERLGHVGHWLVGRGRERLARELGAREKLGDRLGKLLRRRAGWWYTLALVSVGILALVLPFAYVDRLGATRPEHLAVLILAAVPASVIAIGFVNWLVLRWRAPTRLPLLDPRRGVPPGAETLVVVPFIVNVPEAVSSQLEQLEIRLLANPDPRLTYVLLSDLADADMERLPGDDAIEQALSDGIERLNARHPSLDGSRFALLHRPRRFDAAENLWMGRERKRGKLEDLGALIADGWLEPFSLTAGDITALSRARYVITLDADTALPPGSATRLVCTLAHPLNHAYTDPASGRITDGYTVLQPRLETLASSDNGSLFAYLFAGDGAIDIYSRAVSDLYQDLFGCGSYIGKGIYDVRAFHRALEGRVPENRILSHDLFEGLHGRVALASEIVLYEEYPASWSDHARRQHRWIRGDWQLLPWLGRTVPAANGGRVSSRFSGLDRWKLADNLRRSLVPPAMLAWFLAAWFVFPGSSSLWTLLGIGAFAPYLLDETLAGLARVSRRRSSRGVGHRLGAQLARSGLALVFLVGDARVALDAIARALWRTLVSGRRRLEWTTAAQTQAASASTGGAEGTWRLLWPSSALAVAVAIALGWREAGTLPVALPLLVAWFVAPWVARYLARPRHVRRDTLRTDDRDFLRRIGRRTWHYFDTFAGPEEHWLPPDNFQRRPIARLARRTSPTNIGLYLAATVAARDLGFIGTPELNMRARNVLDTLARLERHRGHLFNWYDTETLAPLEPRYVSTVDSGNLAVSLITLAEGCRDYRHVAAIDPRVVEGLLDTLRLLNESFVPTRSSTPIAGYGDKLALQPSTVHSAFTSIEIELERLACGPGDTSATVWRRSLEHMLVVHWAELKRLIGECENEDEVNEDRLAERHTWLERFDHQLRAALRDVDQLCPWLDVLGDAPDECAEEAMLVDHSWPIDTPLAGASVALIACRHALDQAFAESPVHTLSAGRWRQRLTVALTQAADRQQQLCSTLDAIAGDARRISTAMDFEWLYDDSRRLFRVGHDVSSGRPDPNHYDLLASEARIASFVAIAHGDVPLEHWFALGRPIVRTDGGPAVQSWSGSMFEYLMPPLFLPARRDTLLGESESLAVVAQRREADLDGLPWGVSESAFGATDVEGNYQYQAFGTVSLGIRRGLDDDRVVAPYASLLALGVWPRASVTNLRRLADLGALGRHGFVDALDYTPSRRPPDASHILVETWMAHHHGMSLLAIVNALQHDVMPARVLRDPAFRAVELLLHERVPWDAPSERSRTRDSVATDAGGGARPVLPAPWLPARHSPIPPLQLLGNGRLSARLRSDGGSTLLHDGVAVTRWSNDAALEWRGGYRLHAAVEGHGSGWWLGETPDGARAPDVVFGAHGVDSVQHARGMTIRVESAVAAHEDTDIRLVTLVNEQAVPRTVRLTSHAEIALARPDEDERHPAFARMFIASRFEPSHDGLSFIRRSREQGARAPCLLHRIIGDEGTSLVGWESDRRRWLGRLGDPRHPAALTNKLTGCDGYTLDPVMALQVRVDIAPGESRRVAFLALVDTSRSALLERSARLTLTRVERLLAESRAELPRELLRRRLDGALLPILQNFASLLLSPQPALRAVPTSVDEPGCRQNELWSHGLSGDRPIVLLRMHEESPRVTLETLVQAQGYWRHCGLAIDLVVLRTGPTGYDEPLRARLLEVLRDTGSLGQLGRDGGVHLVSVSDATDRPRIALEDAAAVVLDASRPLADSLRAVLDIAALPPPLQPMDAAADLDIPPLERPRALLFDNGLGGFSPDGDAYVIWLAAGVRTPAPWCNVLANERFGAIVSESGLGFSWSSNSGERRLSRWSGDPVLDTPGEVLWLRDEATGVLWTVPPMPPFDETPVEIRHGLGQTQWRRHDHGLEQTLLTLVPTEAPVRLVRLRLVNRSGRLRRMTATYYIEWVLGALPARAKAHVRSGYDARIEAILATNDWNPDFAARVAFLACSKPAHSVTGDRAAFIGEQGDLRRPAALTRTDLGGHFVPGGDSCGAWQVHVDLAPGDQTDVVFVIGEGATRAESEALIRHWRMPAQVETALAGLVERWEHLSGAVRVHTPDPAFDLMVNRWLLYQSVSSRLFARAGFYQASGAWGYRDQLQDVLALLPAEPALARRQILAAAARQFEAGDVMHWWHPPADRGIRTRCSDDRLWLPYATARYVERTGELALLDLDIPFLAGNELAADEEDRYAVFERGTQASLFEHCARALERGMETGTHGLPLIGTGDWNDGMDAIGREGRGESVWLAWFRIAVARAWAPLAEARGATARAARWREHAAALEAAIDTHAWDGEWYVRAFDDAGVPWGSSTSDECRIDVIAQAWGALVGFADKPRVRQALASADARLVDREAQLVRLLTPPFDATSRNPGYIKAYPPGIRENGGQYTHAATWFGLAWSAVGDGERAHEIFDLVSPVHRSASRDGAEHYRTEPYVVAADIGGEGVHEGVGGWSWYTGAAGWAWQLAVRGILGIEHVPGGVRVRPCLPPVWPFVEVVLDTAEGTIALRIERIDPELAQEAGIVVDGEPQTCDAMIAFPGRGNVRRAVVRNVAAARDPDLVSDVIDHSERG